MKRQSNIHGIKKTIKTAIAAGTLFAATFMFSTSGFCTMNPDDLPDGSAYLGSPNSVKMRTMPSKTVSKQLTINPKRLSQVCPAGYVWYVKGQCCITKFD